MPGILEDAISCLQRYAGEPRSRLFLREVEWFHNDTSDRLFSFENVCAVLGLHPSLVRRKLLSQPGKEVEFERLEQPLIKKNIRRVRQVFSRTL